MSDINYWNTAHDKYTKTDWINKPTLFAQSILKYLPKTGNFLDLGAGQGQDSRFFAENGYSITSTDFSTKALKYNLDKLPLGLKNKVTLQQLDLSRLFPFKNNSFDVVYSHLAIHYFDDEITTQIFSEIYRVLKPGGIVALLVNSTNDPEFNTGQKIENLYFKMPYGIRKRFFDQNYLKQKSSQFKTLLLDNNGETYKDRRIGVTNLLRYIGQKV